MARYKIALPDGRVATFEADDPSSALAAANAIPRSKTSAEKSTYTGELVKARKQLAAQGEAYKKVPGLNAVAAATAGPWAPIAGEVTGLLSGAGNMAANVGRRVLGEEPVSSKAIYEANRDATDEYFKGLRGEHPALALGGDIAGALTGGKALTEGMGLLGGLKPVAAATEAMKATKVAQATGKAAAAAKAATTAKVGEKAVRVAGRVAKAAGSGALGGAAYGAAEGRTAEERAANAAKGGEFGAVAGTLLEGVGAPVMEKVVGAAKDVARPVLDRFRPVAAREADDIAKAAQNAALLARNKGVTPQSLEELAAKDAGLDTTFAEALGTEGQNTQAALARRPGATGDAMRAQIRARNLAQPGGITEDFEKMLGVNPEAAAGDISALVEQGKRNAAPEFEAALAGEHGVTSPELERLLATPAGQKLIKGVVEDARNLGEQSGGLTMGRVEVPRGVDVNPVEAPPVGEFKAGRPEVRPGPDTPPPQGHTFLDWFARQGGGKDTGGDLAAMGAERIGTRSRYSSQEIDDLALRAQEAGFLPAGERPTEDDFLKLVRHQTAARAAGKPELRMRPDPEAQAAFDARQADKLAQGQYDQRPREPLDELLGEDRASREYASGFDEPSPGYEGAPAPEFEPAHQEAYTPKSLDQLRRAANEQVKYEFGKLAPGRKNAVKAKFARMLRDALAGPEGALPGLGQALETSSGYLRLKDTFDRFSGKLTRGSDREFKNDWLKLKGETERDAARASLANDIRELWGKGQLRGGKFAVRGVEEKLRTAFGPEGAKAFVARMERRAELAASGNRMAPFSGSPTMTLQEASTAVDQGVEPQALKRIGGKLMAGHPVAALGDAAGTLLMKAITYPKSAGTSTAYRDELGRILGLDAEGAAAFLRSMEKLPPQARREFAAQLGLVAGSQAGAGIAGNREPVPADQR